MPFKPFAHLARVSFAKGIAHGYAPPAVFAGQSSYATTTNSLGQFHNYPANKFAAKATHLTNAFGASSSSGAGSGAGAKAGHTTQASGGDPGLAQYYAAWQHAQQTGDDSEWKQHQSARRIGWKSPSKAAGPKSTQRLDSARPIDLLRPSSYLTSNRAYSESAAQDIRDAEDVLEEAEALAKVDEAIAKEIEDVKASHATAAEDISIEAGPDESGVQQHLSQPSSSDDAVQEESSSESSDLQASTQLTSPVSEAADTISTKIVELGNRHQYGDIPALFESMLRDRLTPTTQAYNHIIFAAIKLSGNDYQVWPRALEIYSNMTSHSAEPDAETYAILIDFLSQRVLQVKEIKQTLDLRGARYGNADGSFALESDNVANELYSADNSDVFATKLFRVARAKIPGFTLPVQTYSLLLEACTQSENVADLHTVLSDMAEQTLTVPHHLFPSLIKLYGKHQNISGAQSLYADYRDAAIARGLNNQLDNQVYAALVLAFHQCGMKTSADSFYGKIIESLHEASDAALLQTQLSDTVFLEALLPHQLQQSEYAIALALTQAQEVSASAKHTAYSRITSEAADADETIVAEKAFSLIQTKDALNSAAISLSAMHLRQGRLSEAQATMTAGMTVSSVDFAFMYTRAMISQGKLVEGLDVARQMFDQLRHGANNAADHAVITSSVDQAIVQFGKLLNTQPLTSQLCISLLRAMVENGGFVTPVAQHAVASLGPQCVHELSAQDIAFALHVQATMLLKATAVPHDIADMERFSHLLETVMSRRIAMDPATIAVVSEGLELTKGMRQDLEGKWHAMLNPAPRTLTQAFSPVPPSPSLMKPAVDMYDPYAFNSDFGASKRIEDQLETTAGRPENHLSDSLNRYRNVRRTGRHLTYRAYGKLITAASKTKQKHLIHEIFGMAQADVPFTAQYASVQAGWVTIFDAMVSACLTIGDRQLAAKFHQDLLDMGATPSANTFGIYITTLEGTFDEATEAVKIFQRAIAEGVEPTVFLYNAVIGKLGKARRIDDCLYYFGDMQNRSVIPTSVTYGTLVNALCRTSEERFAEEMFDEMESRPNYKPRAAPYNSIIQYFLNTKHDRAKVLAYYERMQKLNIKPTNHTYKLLIETHASLQPVNLEAAETVLRDMKAAGMFPDSVHYGTLIHAKGCVMHDMAGARATFDSVLGEGRIRPNDNLYQNLLEAMVANHQVAQTDDILADMKRHGVSMTPYIANTLIHGWASEGDIEKAQTIYEKLASRREPSTYEAMTRAFLSAGRREDAEKVVAECLSKGYPSAVADKVAGLLGA